MNDPTQPGAIVLSFEVSKGTVVKVEKDVADPESKLVNVALHSCLVSFAELVPPLVQTASQGSSPTPGPASGFIVFDTRIPFGELEPLGQECIAQELKEQFDNLTDGMVDQFERAEVWTTGVAGAPLVYQHHSNSFKSLVVPTTTPFTSRL